MKLKLTYDADAGGEMAEKITLTLGDKTLLWACSCCCGVNTKDIAAVRVMAEAYAEKLGVELEINPEAS